ncbi:hypothetical protein [Mycobacterium sp. DBP42]|uniref:aromatic-ring hydroxylase C-terminal domain-containing protein n=1 Tax=Mycobacterium sp. DBP42 TaxID=2545267 RepID=UPI00110CBDD5|nr:hypothetical protein [Mycobacterium sp. DBP42]TMS51188.1 hypothetical protein E0T84_20915 [Mycobacterium sp. DBP42]
MVDPTQEVSVKLGHPINVAQVGADYLDADGTWAAVAEIGNGGALLVRPDNHVAWRTGNLGENPELALAGALASVLSKS